MLKNKSAHYIKLGNTYASLPAISAPLDLPSSKNQHPMEASTSRPSNQSHYWLKVARQRQANLVQQLKQLNDEDFFMHQ